MIRNNMFAYNQIFIFLNRQLISCKSITFEVDDTSIAAELCLQEDDDDDLNLMGLDQQAFTKSLFSTETQKVLSKHGDTSGALADTEFISASFSDLEKTMTSIHPQDLVMKELIRAGTGRKVPDDCKVFVHYSAICEGADEPYDSTLTRKRKVPEIVDMRKAEVLPGFLIAIRSMELNEISKFIVKPVLAFGKVGCPPRIPPNADVLYVIEVVQVIDAQMMESPLYKTAEERALLPFKTIYQAAEELRTAGNGYYTANSYWVAVKKYRKAVSLLEDYPLIGLEDEDKRDKLLHTLYANLAQTYLNLDKPAQACTMCKLGLRVAKKKEGVKLLYRYAKAKYMLKDYENAVSLCDQALKLDPENVDIQNLRKKVPELISIMMMIVIRH